jgi:hypothetical protein
MTTDVIHHMAADATFHVTAAVAYIHKQQINKSYENIHNTARRIMQLYTIQQKT